MSLRAVAVCCCLLTVLVAGPSVAFALQSNDGEQSATAPRQAGAASPPSVVALDNNFTSVEFRLTAFDNQTVRWTFVHKTPLQSDARRSWFEDYAATFEGDDPEPFRDFKRRARGLAANGTRATDRQMRVRHFRSDTEIQGLTDNLGVVRMSFHWTNLTARDSRTQVLSDVFPNGLYLGSNQSLVVRTGPNLTFREVNPTPDSTSALSVNESRSVTWEGEREFNGFRPRVVFAGPNEPAVGDTPVQTTAGGSGNADGTETADGTPLEVAALVVFGLVVVAVAALAVWIYRGDQFLGQTDGADAEPDGATADADTSTTAESAATNGAQTTDTDSGVTDEQLLSDEDRVLKLLDEAGGRMKQSNIVDETEWSKSKVSMLLTDMEDEGNISKLRVGRENIISLPGNEPEAARSPFEDEDP